MTAPTLTKPTARADYDVERHPGDVMRVVAGSALLIVCVVIGSQQEVGTIERDLFRLINDLPQAIAPAMVVLRQLGSPVAVPIAAIVALAFRRPILAANLALAGVVAWAAARGLHDLVDRGAPHDLLPDVQTHGRVVHGTGFPSAQVAVAAALASAASPWLTRPLRRTVWVIVALVGLAGVYLGAELPVDAIGGAALGWLVGAACHLAFGTPSRRPTVDEVRNALEAAGLDLTDVHPAVVDARGSTPFFATTADGRSLFVKIVGREQRNADVLFKAWRWLAFRELEDEEPFASPKRELEHEAYLALLAERAGVRTPTIVATTDAARNQAVLAQIAVDGHTLDAVEPAAVDDAVLAGIWHQVTILRRSRLAHRDLRQANVLVDAGGAPWLIDFGFAEAAASERRLSQDIAELLASLACLVGSARAVSTAVAALGPGAVAGAAPLLEPLALSTATRHDVKAHPGLLDELREAISTTTGTEVPQPERLTRVKPSTVLTVLALGFAIHLLLPQVGEFHQMGDAVGHANWGWLVVALVLSAASYAMGALALMGAVGEPLPWGRTTEVQVASSFANRLTPSNLGGIGINVRYLQRTGVDRTAGVAAMGLDTVAGLIVHVMALVVAFALVGSAGVGDVKLPKGWVVLVAVVAVLAAVGVVLATSVGRRRVLAPVRSAFRDLGRVMRRPKNAFLLFVGSAGITASYALALAASLHAFHADVSLTKVAAVYLGGAAIAAVSPTPGGLGAMEAALVAGLTAVGVQPGAAVAGVLSFRLVTFWIPVLPGWLMFRFMRKRGDL